MRTSAERAAVAGIGLDATGSTSEDGYSQKVHSFSKYVTPRTTPGPGRIFRSTGLKNEDGRHGNYQLVFARRRELRQID